MAESSDLAREALYGAIMNGWLKGATHALDGLPEWSWGLGLGSSAQAETQDLRTKTQDLSPPPPVIPPVTAGDLFGDEPPIGVDLVSINHAIETLQSRAVMQPEEFHALDSAARQQAFTITADLATESIAKLRDALAADVAEGPSLGSFRDGVLEEFDTLPIAEHHLENVYRSNINEAFSQGMEKVLDHPLVEDAFPYRRYVAIHDARARHEHVELERLGLDGTDIYHKDDPTWKKFRPPWAWQCRCGWIALATEQAAAAGVREAIAWQAAIAAATEAGAYNGLPSSVEPDHIWVPPPPFNPPPGWEKQ